MVTTSHDRLARVLQTLRMRSTFSCQADLGAPWALEMPAIADSVSFHVVTAGSCWLRLPGADAIELRAGDLALVPHGAGHDLVSDAGGRRGPRVDLLPQDYVTESYSVLRHGGDGRATQLFCGIVSFDDPAARRLMASLPAVLFIGGDTLSAASSVKDTLRLMASELSRPRVGGETVATRLADILVIQAIRSWLADDATQTQGWVRALEDDRIGRVLEAVHARPGDEWTLDRLARVATMSKSSFSARFAELVDEAPISYVTRWRMTLAAARLRDEDITAGRLSAELGYRSEAAFTRAFARVNGQTPGAMRRGRY